MYIPAYTASTPYSERRMQVALRVAPRLAIDTVDTYVAGLTTVGMPVVSAMQPVGALGQSVVASARTAAEALPLLNGALAVGHGIAGLYCFFSDPPFGDNDTALRARKLMALGEMVTAAGFAGQAFGLGVWALPVTAVGLVTATVAHSIRAGAQS